MAWYQFVPWPKMSFEDGIRYALQWKGWNYSNDQELADLVGKKLGETFLKVNNQLKMPVGFHALMVYAEKP